MRLATPRDTLPMISYIRVSEMRDKYVDIQDSYVNMQHMLTYIDMQEICYSMRIIKISKKFQILPKFVFQHAI